MNIAIKPKGQEQEEKETDKKTPRMKAGTLREKKRRKGEEMITKREREKKRGKKEESER
jgi:hypothetical protein